MTVNRIWRILFLFCLLFGATSLWAQKATFIGHLSAAGSGSGQVDGPQGIAINSFAGIFYVSDFTNNRIQRFDLSGSSDLQFAPLGSNEGETNDPRSLAIHYPTQKIYVVDANNNRIQRFSYNGAFELAWGSLGTGNGQFMTPSNIAVNQRTGEVYVTELSNPRVQRFDADGTYLGQWGSPGTAQGQFQNSTHSIAVNSVTGQVYVGDAARIQRFNAKGAFERQWGSAGSGPGQFNYPIDIAIDSAQLVYVVDTNNHRVQQFDADGNFRMAFGSSGSGSGQLANPKAIDLSVNGMAYVTDYGNNRISQFQIADGNKVSPPAAINLGTISKGKGNYQTADKKVSVNLSKPTQIQWYRFKLLMPANAPKNFYFDIVTRPKNAAGSFPSDDTGIALFRSNGTLIASNDDSGVGYYSQLSFNRTDLALPVRGPIPDSNHGPSDLAYGVDGGLPAGEYYLAVTGYHLVSGTSGFRAGSNGGATGSFDLEFRTNIPENRPAKVTVNKKSIKPTKKAAVVVKGKVVDPEGYPAKVFVRIRNTKFAKAKVKGKNWQRRVKLTPGQNRGRVYSVDSEGLKSKVVRFAIRRNR